MLNSDLVLVQCEVCRGGCWYDTFLSSRVHRFYVYFQAAVLHMQYATVQQISKRTRLRSRRLRCHRGHRRVLEWSFDCSTLKVSKIWDTDWYVATHGNSCKIMEGFSKSQGPPFPCFDDDDDVLAVLAQETAHVLKGAGGRQDSSPNRSINNVNDHTIHSNLEQRPSRN